MKTIQISDEFHTWLKEQGRMGESFEDLLVRLLKAKVMMK